MEDTIDIEEGTKSLSHELLMSSSSSRSASPASGRIPPTTEPTEKERAASGANEDGEDDDVWDPAVETHPRAHDDAAPKKLNRVGESASESTAALKVTGDATQSEAAASTGAEATAAPPTNDWQAIYSPAHGAYYFFNAVTQETTWTNPLVPDSSTTAAASSSTTSATQSLDPHNSSTANPSEPSSSLSAAVPQPSTSTLRTLPTADELGGIDPDLAFLDPSLAYTSSSSKLPGGAVPTFTAKFNAHTGRFASGAAGARDPNHVSEYERAKRMSEAYFDVDEWKKQVEERENAKKRELDEDDAYDGGGKRSKKPTKADLVSFLLELLLFASPETGTSWGVYTIVPALY